MLLMKVLLEQMQCASLPQLLMPLPLRNSVAHSCYGGEEMES